MSLVPWNGYFSGHLVPSKLSLPIKDGAVTSSLLSLLPHVSSGPGCAAPFLACQTPDRNCPLLSLLLVQASPSLLSPASGLFFSMRSLSATPASVSSLVWAPTAFTDWITCFVLFVPLILHSK